MKTQDTRAALEQLRPIACLQNGVENERLALRFSPNVYGVCVMTPAAFLEPGIIRCYARPRPAILDVGRYPEGRDHVAGGLAAVFAKAGLGSEVHLTSMRQKYGKLLVNLGNVVQATLGAHPRVGELRDAVRKEGEAALQAAGIEVGDAGLSSPRRGDMTLAPVKGEAHPGGSSATRDEAAGPTSLTGVRASRTQDPFTLVNGAAGGDGQRRLPVRVRSEATTRSGSVASRNSVGPRSAERSTDAALATIGRRTFQHSRSTPAGGHPNGLGWGPGSEKMHRVTAPAPFSWRGCATLVRCVG